MKRIIKADLPSEFNLTVATLNERSVNMENLAPKMTPDELVEKIKEKNIRCEIKSECEIAEYLKERNNYFRTASYRKNYEKYLEGEKKDKYIDLDFGYLTELSTIDMHLRFLVLKMCLDIEHSLKVTILSDITLNDKEDGYTIVKSFLDKNEYILKDIYYKSNSTYVGDLIKKYFVFETHEDENKKISIDKVTIKCPVWAFMEIITFGEFTKFYSMYYEAYPKKEDYTGLINSVKSLRNACAHNNCLIHNLRKGTSKSSHKVSKFVTKIGTIKKSERKKALSVRPVYELTALACLYSEVVFEPVKEHRLRELHDLVHNRMTRNADYFEKQDIIKSSYNFFRKIVDFLIENTYNTNDIKKH